MADKMIMPVMGPLATLKFLRRLDGKKPQFTRGNPFWKKCQAALPRREYHNLVSQGYCLHRFPNDRQVMFTISGTYETLASIMAIELTEKRVIAAFDFGVGSYDNSEQPAAYMPIPVWIFPLSFTGKTAAALNDLIGLNCYGLNPLWDDFDTNNAAFWVRQGYRRQDGSGYTHLSHLLMGTAVRIFGSFGKTSLTLTDVSTKPQKTGHRSMAEFYQTEFGAVPLPQELGNGWVRLFNAFEIRF